VPTETSSVPGAFESSQQVPGWKHRSVERSVANAKARATRRAQRFMHAALAIMAERDTTDITVQEVVDRSQHSLHSFYTHFDGKDELLLALYEDAIAQTCVAIRAATAAEPDPLQRLRIAIAELFVFYRPSLSSSAVLLAELAPRLLLSHPVGVRRAYRPLKALFVDMLRDIAAAGLLRSDVSPRRVAMLTMQMAMSTAHMTAADAADPLHEAPTSDEVWTWCAYGFTTVGQ
jgi:AcrR family transcriptional regulator